MFAMVRSATELLNVVPFLPVAEPSAAPLTKAAEVPTADKPGTAERMLWVLRETMARVARTDFSAVVV